ncbi:MAG TPA: fumarylacetoacetate hydrolase family protein [Candidatus Dormibacteraeota bacterium]|nr:fumarylacetoacetate hydrolase family protein [Candidatus Dormibacteraeota bacterium]
MATHVRARYHDRIVEGILEDDRIRTEDGAAFPRSEATLLAPVVPSKIVCVGRNYAAHAKELGNEVPTKPLLFFKPPSSVIAAGEPIVYPPQSKNVHYEGELAVIVGTRARNVPAARAMEIVRGYTIGNDVTARDLQAPDGQWARAKGMDTFCPLGPVWVDAADLDLSHVRVRTLLNGEVRQDGNTQDFIFTLPVLLEYITAAMTLEPGDVVLTGTPEGVGAMQVGDTVTVVVDGIGELSNPLVAP